jgi:hypothetical protein
MKQNVSEHDFIDGFQDSQYKDNFSFKGLRALYDYLIDYEEDCGTETEFDIVAIACDFSEYENLKEFHHDCDTYETMKDVEDNNSVIYVDEPNDWSDPDGEARFIIQNF